MSDDLDETGAEAGTAISVAAAKKLAAMAPAREKAIFGVPIEVTVSVGKARPMISEIVSLRRDSCCRSTAGSRIRSRSMSARS